MLSLPSLVSCGLCVNPGVLPAQELCLGPQAAFLTVFSQVNTAPALTVTGGIVLEELGFI